MFIVSMGNDMKILYMEYNTNGTKKDWLVSTMYLRGARSLCLPYSFFNDVVFYAHCDMQLGSMAVFKFKMIKWSI